jgi:hydrogenase maturation protein HypF
MVDEKAHFIISVYGTVQGVGFRPFIYRLALEHELAGTVRNTSGCVEIDVEGPRDNLQHFLVQIENQAPSAARIEKTTTTEQPLVGFGGFRILLSQPRLEDYQPLSPDLATCPTCMAEIFDLNNRRFRYPFTNCTNCGPRFTIITGIPYDRPLTTMSKFTMCPDCRHEYNNPQDRRFHAQPNACHVCGPQLELINGDGIKIDCADHLMEAAYLLKTGNIVAIKGLGGFQLACDATNDEAVIRLRQRKKRPAKPFAVMVRDIESAKKLCYMSMDEEKLFASPPGPIVLLKTRMPCELSAQVAPGLKYLGLMLPYTPLHHLLLADVGLALVMTSGNMSEEPIARDNDEALSRLSSVADYFLMHNRDIHVRYDDSVVMQADGVTRMLRRARGYAPSPIKLSFPTRAILAVGAEMKGAFCLIRDDHAFLSQHIGDMENLETLSHYENTLEVYKRLFRIEPQIIACDLHPDYMSTIYAKELVARSLHLKLVTVQHHHAHIASVLAESGEEGPVIGVAFDGTGYGIDGAIWGGEFLLVALGHFERLAHLEYIPLPGGDIATRNPYRVAISYVCYLLGKESLDERLPLVQHIDKNELTLLMQQIERRLNTPHTSSCGRLFDAVAALIGICSSINYEAQAALELEMAATDFTSLSEKPYPFEITEHDGPGIIRLNQLFSAILDDIYTGASQSEIAYRFHLSIAVMVAQVCARLSCRTGIKTVALSGGVFQNRLLLHLALQELKKCGLSVLTNRLVPANDGGIALGQAAIAQFTTS